MDLILVTEDELSMAVMQRLLSVSGRDFRIYAPIVTGGVDAIRLNVPVYRNACHVLPHVVLVDLDRTACAPTLVKTWGLDDRPGSLLFRVVVRTVEAWLIADAVGLAEELLVAQVKVPAHPEDLEHPKRELVNLARRSRSRRLAAEIAPAPGSRANVGPKYNVRLCDFVLNRWDPSRAAVRAPSLARAMHRLDEFMR